MGVFADRFAEVYRDYFTVGVPSSGEYEPQKSDIRNIGALLDAAIAVAAQGMAAYSTLAAAQAAAAVTPGTQARVFNDPTAANNGVYVNKTGNVGGYTLDVDFYNQIAAIVQPLVTQAQQAVTDANTAAASGRTGASLHYLAPNRFTDGDMLGTTDAGWNEALTTGTSRGRRTLTATGSDRSIRVGVGGLGGPGATFSAGIDVEARTFVGGSPVSVLVRQLQANGTLISSSTLFSSGTTSATPNSPAPIENITIAANAAFIEFYLFVSGNAANSITISIPGIYAGASGAYRPVTANKFALPANVDDVRAGLSRVFTQPNLVGTVGGTLGNRSGRESRTTTGTTRNIDVPVSSLAGATTFSVGMLLEAAGYTSGGGNSILVQQLNAAGTAVVSTTLSSLGTANRTYDPPTSLRAEAIALDGTATTIRIAIVASGNGANFVEISLPGVYAGDSAAYRPAMPGGAFVDQINDVRSAVGLVGTPNLHPDPEFRWTTYVGSNIWNVNAPTPATVNGRRAVVAAGDFYTDLPTDVFGGEGSTMSACVTVEAAAYPGGAGSIGANWLELIFYDAANAAIGTAVRLFTITAVTVPQNFKMEGVAIPAGAVRVRLNGIVRGSGNNYTISRLGLYRGSKGDYRPCIGPERTVANVAPTGADTNDGSAESPFATPGRAYRSLRDPRSNLHNGVISFADGDYTGFINLSSIQGAFFGNVGDLRLEARPGARVRINNGVKLTGVTKTAGQDNVYQAAVSAANAPSNQGGYIFEHDTPEGLIPLNERHPFHLGKTHRSPSYRMVNAASVAACNTTPGSWFYSAGVLYFHAVASTDPTSSGKEYYIPRNFNSGSSGYGTDVIGGGSAGNLDAGAKRGRLEATGITAMYGSTGFNMAGLRWFKLTRCDSIGNQISGFSNSTVSGETHMCRAIANCGDGAGGMGTTGAGAGSTMQNPRVEHHALYCAMNGDDGWSEHNRCNSVMFGCLSEYNNDGGYVPVLGAEVLWVNCHARKNGQSLGGPTNNIGEGFGLRQAPDADEGGVNVSAMAISCVSEGNTRNFAVNASPNNLRCIDCVSLDASFAGYMVGDAGARIELNGCSSDGDAVPRYGGGFGGSSVGTFVTRARTELV